jgi:hypothetical protein
MSIPFNMIPMGGYGVRQNPNRGEIRKEFQQLPIEEREEILETRNLPVNRQVRQSNYDQLHEKGGIPARFYVHPNTSQDSILVENPRSEGAPKPTSRPPSINSVKSSSSRYSGNWFRKQVLDPINPLSPPPQKDLDSWKNFATQKFNEHSKATKEISRPSPQEPKNSPTSKRWKDANNRARAWERVADRVNTIKSFIPFSKK